MGSGVRARVGVRVGIGVGVRARVKVRAGVRVSVRLLGAKGFELGEVKAAAGRGRTNLDLAHSVELCKVRPERVSSRPVWGLLVSGSSPMWHTEGDEGRGKHHDDVGGEQRYLVGAHAAHLVRGRVRVRIRVG